jgi:HEAT repeat protein
MSPRERIEKASRVYGGESVALWCAELLSGQVSHDAEDRPSITWLGGAHAEALLRYEQLGVHEYWPRVWAARGLLYAWSPRAVPAVISALEDSAWRVREMALKVIRRREIGEAADAAASLAGDEVTRVRVAALRALALVGEGEHAEPVRDALEDPEPSVRDAALSAIETMTRRLERPL